MKICRFLKISILIICLFSILLLPGCSKDDSPAGPSHQPDGGLGNQGTAPSYPADISLEPKQYNTEIDAGPANLHAARYRLSNGMIEVMLDPTTGHVLRITDLTKAKLLVLNSFDPDIDPDITPFRIDKFVTLSDEDSKATACQPVYPPKIDFCSGSLTHCRTITWECDPGGRFEAKVELTEGKAEANFTGAAYVSPDERIYDISYPALGGISRHAEDPHDDTLAIPFEGGMLINDPSTRVREEVDASNSLLKNLNYPNGHSMMAQMISFQTVGVGGFALYTADNKYTRKYFHIMDATPDHQNPTLMAYIEHLNWDVNDYAGQNGMILDYPVVVSTLPKTGRWQDAAKIYRDWAEVQPWAAAPIIDRTDDDRRLYESAGLSVFGLSAREDQTEWYRAFHDVFCQGIDNARVLFVPGWDFHPNGEMVGEPTFAFYQGAWDESWWLPYQGSFVDNYRVMKGENDDFVYPFFYDLLVHDGSPGWDGWTGSAVDSGDLGAPWQEHELINEYGLPGGLNKYFPGFPGKTHTLDPYNQLVRDYYLWRNRLIVDTTQEGEHLQMDGTYHDVSISFVTKGCYSENHEHPRIGSGRWLSQSIRDLHQELFGTQADRATSIGMENATEIFWDQIDFYHLGDAGVGPIRMKTRDSDPDHPEFSDYHAWVMNGDMWDIPMTAYLYHPYGSLRTGGKIQISNEFGDVFYWIAASEYLWGGILELIYFNSSADILPGIDPDNVPCPDGWPCAFQTGWATGQYGNQEWQYGEQAREADPDKIAFLRDAIYLRLHVAPDYLITGQMENPPTLDPPAPMADYDYDFYSHINGENYHHNGTYQAPAVLVEAWSKFDTGQVAFILSNPTDTTRTTAIVFDPADYGLDKGVPTLIPTTNFQGQPVQFNKCDAGQSCRVDLTLEPRSFVMVELQ